MSKNINRGTMVEWSRNGEGGLGRSALSALNGGGVPPDFENEVGEVAAEGEALHEIVHMPTLNWFKELAERHGNGEGIPPEVVNTAAGCIGLAIFRSFTNIFDPSGDPEAENMLELIIASVYVGACLHQDIANGDLDFENDSE